MDQDVSGEGIGMNIQHSVSCVKYSRPEKRHLSLAGMSAGGFHILHELTASAIGR